MTYKQWNQLRWVILGPFLSFCVLFTLFAIGYPMWLSHTAASSHPMLGPMHLILKMEAKVLTVLGVLFVPIFAFSLVSGILMRRRKEYEQDSDNRLQSKSVDLDNVWPPAPDKHS